MNTSTGKVLLPNDVRKMLNVDNREIIDLCRRASITPKKDNKGQVYFLAEEVRKLKNIQTAVKNNMKDKKVTLPVMTKQDSQLVVNNLIDSLSKMEDNITTSVTKVLDEKLEGMDDVVLELVRCKTENENLKNKINELNKENFKIKSLLNSFKPLFCGFYIKKDDDNIIL